MDIGTLNPNNRWLHLEYDIYIGPGTGQLPDLGPVQLLLVHIIFSRELGLQS